MADLFKVNADLHLHGLYSGAVSEQMIPKNIGAQAPQKGIQLLGSADILNDRWVKLIKEQLKPVSDDIMEHENGTKFVLQTEVEVKDRTHHIILFPSLSKVYEVKEKLKKYCKDFESDGRPKVWCSTEELAEACIESDCLLGFAHAFTPYFGLYSKFNSYKEAYGDYWDRIYFMELGLSADTDMADRISELHNLTFTSNSDAHSPWPNKLGREFNTFLMAEISFEELKKALKREDGRKCVLNVKFNPLEGKYHKTRCRGCLTFFEPKQAEKFYWRCPVCKDAIKKGVDFRISELANVFADTHPVHRPRCQYIIPLSEIIALAFRVQNTWSEKVQAEWKKFIDRFGPETKVLLETSFTELKQVNPKVAEYIQLFREDRIKYIPGGAGVYGKLVPPEDVGKVQIKKFPGEQKTLENF